MRTLIFTLVAGFFLMLQAQPLKQQAQRINMLMGAAVQANQLNETAFAGALTREMNMVTAEYEMKWIPMRPAADRFDFTASDRIVNFAISNGMLVRGHTLLWHEAVPDWLRPINSPQQLSSLMQTHIDTVMKRYQGRIFAWDVVNEAFHDNGSLRDTIWYNQPGIGFAGQGTKFIEQAFVWARAADPTSLLFYNDFGIETFNPKSDASYAMLADFRARRIPVDGIGMQFHVDLSFDTSRVQENIRRFADLGLQVHITELDVRIPKRDDLNPIDAQDLQRQAQKYREIVNACLAVARCTAIQTWGLTDRYSWIDSFYPGMGLALLLNRNYEPKPAHAAVSAALAAAPSLGRPPIVITPGPGPGTANPDITAVSSTFGSSLAAPGSLLTLFGKGLAESTQAASSLPLPTTLAGLRVDVQDRTGNTRSAALSFVSPEQVNLVLPPETATGAVTLTVRSTSTQTLGITVQDVAPSLFTAAQTGSGPAAGTAVRVTGNTQQDVPIVECRNGSCSALPIPLRTGSSVIVSLFGTGFRQASASNTWIRIGNLSLRPAYVGPHPQFAGLDQVNVEIPNELSGLGRIDLTLTVNGIASNTVQLWVQ